MYVDGFTVCERENGLKVFILCNQIVLTSLSRTLGQSETFCIKFWVRKCYIKLFCMFHKSLTYPREQIFGGRFCVRTELTAGFCTHNLITSPVAGAVFTLKQMTRNYRITSFYSAFHKPFLLNVPLAFYISHIL